MFGKPTIEIYLRGTEENPQCYAVQANGTVITFPVPAFLELSEQGWARMVAQQNYCAERLPKRTWRVWTNFYYWR